jgi:hypothetical protein
MSREGDRSSTIPGSDRSGILARYALSLSARCRPSLESGALGWTDDRSRFHGMRVVGIEEHA